jgi:hypothetical protein
MIYVDIHTKITEEEPMHLHLSHHLLSQTITDKLTEILSAVIVAYGLGCVRTVCFLQEGNDYCYKSVIAASGSLIRGEVEDAVD